MSEKTQTILVILAMVIIGIAFLTWVSNTAEKDIKERVEAVNRDFKYSKGKIIDIRSYKGHSVEVRYKIDDKILEFSGKWDRNPNHLVEGDSIKLRYSTESPELIITELENEY